MAKSSRGILVVLFIGAVVGVGGGLYYVFVETPRQVASKTRDAIGEWGKKWESARECIVGPNPQSTLGDEAVILRELYEPDPIDTLRLCNERLKGFIRTGEHSHSDAVEDAWVAADRAVEPLATALAWRTAKEPLKDGADLRSDLARTVAQMDRTYSELRTAAGMEPFAAPGPGPAPPLSGVEPVSIAGDDGPEISEHWVGPERIGFRARSASQRWQVVQSSRTEHEVSVSGPGVLAAIGSASPAWGVWIEADGAIQLPATPTSGPYQLRCGPLDLLGDPADDGVVVATSAPASQGLTPLLAMATGEARVVLWMERLSTAIWWATSADGGLTWTAPRHTPDDPRVLLDLLYGAANMLWPTDGGAWRWVSIDQQGIFDLLLAGDPELLAAADSVCAAGSSLWVLSTGALHYASTGTDRLRPVPGSAVADNVVGVTSPMVVCTADRAALVERYRAVAPGQGYYEVAQAPEETRVLLCGPSKCGVETTVPMAKGARSRVSLSPTGALALVLESDGLVVAWWSAGDRQPLRPHRLGRLPAPLALADVVLWRDGLTLLVDSPLSLVHIDLP